MNGGENKMKKTAIILGAGVLLLSGLSVLSGTVSAYRGDPAVKGPEYSEKRHEAMETIFEKGDFNAWKEMMQGRGRVLDIVNEDNFSRFVEAHELAEEGKIDEARQIRQELGLGLQNGVGQRRGGMGKGCQE